jgi:hypothetical protein
MKRSTRTHTRLLPPIQVHLNTIYSHWDILINRRTTLRIASLLHRETSPKFPTRISPTLLFLDHPLPNYPKDPTQRLLTSEAMGCQASLQPLTGATLFTMPSQHHRQQHQQQQRKGHMVASICHSHRHIWGSRTLSLASLPHRSCL